MSEILDDRPLLLLIEQSDELNALVRSGERRVLRWSSNGGGEFKGDPTVPDTYERARAARVVSAIIDLQDDELAGAAVRALREVRPDAAVLMLSEHRSADHGDGTLARAGNLRDVLRLDLDEELERLEAQRRAHCVRRFAEGEGPVPILVHPDPDPDALSSALAVRTLLDRSADDAPIVTLQGMRRHENQRMAELLHLRVTEVTRAELAEFDRIIAVDMQPSGLFEAAGPRLAVIDHHPLEDGYHSEFRDVRTGVGAAATLLTQYLRAWDERRVSATLAAALLHGIRTDTDALMRGVSPADVDASGFLQARADRALLRRIEKPSYTVDAARTYGGALHTLHAGQGIVVAHAGELPTQTSHILPEIADFCLGIDTTVLAAATGYVEDELVMALRYAGGRGPDAGALARQVANEGGRGGGHAEMARAALPRSLAEERFGGDEVELPARVQRYLQQLADGMVSRRS